MRVSVAERKTAKISRVVKGDIISEDGEFFEVTGHPESRAQGMVTVRMKRLDGTNKTRSREYDYYEEHRVNLVK